MQLSFFDSHAHLTGAALHPEVEAVVARAKTAGVDKIINICTDIDTLTKGIALADKFPWIFNAAATTPHDVAKEGEQVFPIIAGQAAKGRLIAIGETGLDYFYEHSAKEIQQHFLRKYLKLALEFQLPVIIHCREAFSDLFDIIDQEYTVHGRHAPGVLHCFTGTMAEAEAVLKRGWLLSLSGIVTFKKSTQLQEVAKMVPLQQLLIETDAPYLAPQTKRGKQNEPAYLPETAAFIASIKGLDTQVVAEASFNNALKQFNIKQ